MQFSTRSALAALLMATDALACGKGYHHRPRPTTLQTSTLIATPVPSSTPIAEAPAVPTILPTVIESSSSASSSSSSVVIEPSTSSSSSSAASTPTTPATSGLTTDEQAALDSQNSARSAVGATALTWDAGLASDALEWAQHLASSGSAGTLTHSTTTSEGENLYWQSNSDSPYANAANAWVGEKDLYNGEAITGSGNFEEYGHYTQIIWASTSKVGMAVASDGSGGYYVVARYDPAGNVIGETPSSG